MVPGKATMNKEEKGPEGLPTSRVSLLTNHTAVVRLAVASLPVRGTAPASLPSMMCTKAARREGAGGCMRNVSG